MMNYFKSYFTKFYCVSFFLIFLFANAYAAEAPSFVVVIDAGHGGHDPGALGSISQEKNINLSIALEFGRMIEKNDPSVKVIYTRKTDKYLTLQERADVANNAHADLFVCVHTNANNNPEATGAETYTLGLTKSKSNLDVAMRENSVILLEDDYKVKYEGFNPKSVDSYIMFECIQDKYIDKSVQIASDIQKSFVAVGRKDRGVRQAGFWVLHKTAMPSILVEVGYITNPEEERFLNSSSGQQKIADAIYSSFERFRKEYARKSGKANYVSASAFDGQGSSDTSTRNLKVTESVNKKEQAQAVEKNSRRKSRSNAKSRKEERDSIAASNKAQKEALAAAATKTSKKEKTSEARHTSVKDTIAIEKSLSSTSTVNRHTTKHTNTKNTSQKDTAENKSFSATLRAIKNKKSRPATSSSSAPAATPVASSPDAVQTTNTVAAAATTSQAEAASTTASQSGVVYKLQLFAVSKKLPEKTPLFKGLKTEYFEEGQFFKYTYGSTSDYATILKMKKQIAAKFPNAMVIAFKNGQKVSLQDVSNSRNKVKKQSKNKI